MYGDKPYPGLPKTEKVPGMSDSQCPNQERPGQTEMVCHLVCIETPGPELAAEAASSLASWSLGPHLVSLYLAFEGLLQTGRQGGVWPGELGIRMASE